MENNEECRPAEVLWNQMIDIKTDGMVEKKKNRGLEDVESGQSGRKGGGQGLHWLQHRSDTDHTQRSECACYMGLAWENSPLWWQAMITCLKMGVESLICQGGFPVSCSHRHCAARDSKVSPLANRMVGFKWQASCTGQNTFSEPFARTRIYLWFHVPDVGHRGSQEFPAWCWNLPSASRNCNLQRGAPTDGCPSLSANNFQPPEYFK